MHSISSRTRDSREERGRGEGQVVEIRPRTRRREFQYINILGCGYQQWQSRERGHEAWVEGLEFSGMLHLLHLYQLRYPFQRETSPGESWLPHSLHVVTSYYSQNFFIIDFSHLCETISYTLSLFNIFGHQLDCEPCELRDSVRPIQCFILSLWHSVFM